MDGYQWWNGTRPDLINNLVMISEGRIEEICGDVIIRMAERISRLDLRA